jgi:hypothetical protein
MSYGLVITLVFFFFTVAITLVVIRELCNSPYGGLRFDENIISFGVWGNFWAMQPKRAITYFISTIGPYVFC